MFERVQQLPGKILTVVQDRDVWSDVSSALILILMILTLWLAGWREYRPAKHLFEWIRRYPMLAAFYGLFTLMSWGVIGTEYGVRTLLIADDALVQFLCGFALISIFLRLSFQYVVLDRKRQRWLWTLDTCLDVEHAIFGGSMRVRLAEPEENAAGAGEEGRQAAGEASMTVADLKRLLRNDVARQDGGGEVMGVLDSDRFRIAMSPLILDFYASILVVFLGLIPLIFGLQPLLGDLGEAWRSREFLRLGRSALELISERGSWLFGVLAGVLLAKSLVRASTYRFQNYVSDMVQKALAADPQPNRRLTELKQEWPARPRMIETLTKALEQARERDRNSPLDGSGTWRKLPFLSTAAAMTLLIFANLYAAEIRQAADLPPDPSRNSMVEALSEVVRSLGIAVIAFVPLGVAFGIVGFLAVAFVELVRRGFRLVMGKSVFAFRGGGLAGVGLIVLAFAGVLAGMRTALGDRLGTLAYPLLAVVASIVIQRLSMIGEPPGLARKRVRSLTGYWLVTLLAVPMLASSWSRAIPLDPGWPSNLMGIAKYLVALKAGSWIVRWTMTLFDPLISYPVSAIWGFLAFGGLFVELPEPIQAQVPAAFTVIYFAGVMASAITCVLHSDSLSDPKRIVFALIVTLLILGQGWTTSPNQFKIRFPGLDGQSMLAVRPGEPAPDVVNYYEKPVRLNSEAYFRITNRSVIKLHLQDDTVKKNRQRSIRASNRLASGMIPPVQEPVGDPQTVPRTSGVKVAADGSLVFRYFDEQNVGGDTRSGSDYLRLRAGDPLELIRLDTRFDFVPDAAGKSFEIRLNAGGLELDFPKPAVAGKIYEMAEALTVKLTDRLEMDSGIRAALRRKPNGEWTADFEGGRHGVTVAFSNGTIRIGGVFAEKLLERIGTFEKRMNADADPAMRVRMQRIDSAIVTASWPATVLEVEHRTLPATTAKGSQPVFRTEIDVRWPVVSNGKKSAFAREEAKTIASFLHMAYLVSGAEGSGDDGKRGKLLEAIVSGNGERPPAEVWDLIAKHLRFEGVGDDLIHSGDCLRFEFLGWESPARIADLVRIEPRELSPEWEPVLRPYLLSDRAMWEAIRQAPGSKLKGFDDSSPGLTDEQIAARFVGTVRDFEKRHRPRAGVSGKEDPGNLFVLRQATDSGVFAFDAGFDREAEERTGTRVAFVYGSHRIREHDRLVLQWKDGQEGVATNSATYEVVGLDVDTTGAGPLPPGKCMAVKLQPIDTRGVERADGGRAASAAFQDELPGRAGRQRLAGTWSRLESLDNYEVLGAWKEANLRADGRKPKLVIVTVSGGGIRSEVWTATVLETLDRNLGAEFSKSIRIVTGASGGMVAASDFVASMTRSGLNRALRHRPVPDPADEAEARGRSGYLTRNQLDSVIGQMIYSDIPGALNPLPRKVDRGRTLEKSWARIAREENSAAPSPFERSIRELAAGEAAGWRPSIVFTPMMVEDGRRLLISNLDLSFVTRNVSALLMEENRRKIKHAAYEINASDRLINRADDLLSLSAVEFYRIFPDAWEFSLGTATRMSASFPWVAPAVSIPTIPPRRIVDAGYYDNFGVNLASLWLAEMREWLKQNTSGVLLVQIRDHESQSRRTDIDFDLESGKNASTVRETFDKLTNSVFERNVGHVLHPVMTPVSGAATARSWTMSFRNDEQVELLDELFNAQETEEDAFFRTVVFECPVEASLSWNLSEEEIVNITAGFGAKDPGKIEPEPAPPEGQDAPDAEKRENLHKRKMLKAIGIGEKRIAALRDTQVKELHENIFGNRKRIQLLRNWWNR